MDSKASSSSSSSHNSDPPSPASASSSASSLHPTFSNKRLILCCDGTWQDSDSTSAAHPTNVTRLSRCFAHRSGSSIQQIVYYQSGVGTSGGLLNRLTGGVFGSGIAENIREAYAFLCTNWAPGDEIILIGFSRGAFTARSVAGMVTALGLLTVAGLDRFAEIFLDSQHLLDRRKDKSGKPSIDDFPGRQVNCTLLDDITTAYRTWLLEQNLTRATWADEPGYAGSHGANKITIKAVAVFDTVGSLGIPDLSLFYQLGLQPMHSGYQFWDTSLSPVIENSFHALALDETRTPFNPTIWEQEPIVHQQPGSENDPKPWLTKYNVRQMWFPGTHSDVGGGSEEAVGASIANLSLAWMLDQLSSVGCELVYDVIHNYFSGKPSTQPKDPAQWSCGRINTRFYRGLTTRKPLQYTAGKLAAGRHTDRFLWATNETIHASVRMRLQLHGAGGNNRGRWQARALAGWKLQLVPCDAALLDTRDTLGLAAADVQMLALEDMPRPEISGYKWLGTDREVAGKLAGIRQWVWKYTGPEDLDNCVQVGGFSHVNKYMYEQPLGPFERYLLHVCGGVSLFKQVDVSRGPVMQPPVKRYDIWLTVKMKTLRRWLNLDWMKTAEDYGESIRSGKAEEAKESVKDETRDVKTKEPKKVKVEGAEEDVETEEAKKSVQAEDITNVVKTEESSTKEEATKKMAAEGSPKTVETPSSSKAENEGTDQVEATKAEEAKPAQVTDAAKD
ncbi:hypothetical protein TD95_002923 [Thielaviopsis punctulata]|uniref:T6SS Phospholipase effector Tle1-like catalytic domain-containing protein n=1 Tax=Thielaviopsis punctulata TaxID=72032 RepID=A0A0F4Z924_9PEZI|nr:hypothetical protein TD95_002923 [Thielaviopsis punctulata]